MQTSPEGLTRVIGVRKLAISAVNLTIGAGIFAVPAVVAGHLGSAAILAYLICAILMTLVLLCFVEVGSGISSTGGVYEYVGFAFGPYAGFLTNMLFVGFALSADAAVANVLVDNLGQILPSVKLPAIRFILMVMIFGSIAVMNVVGVRQGLRLVEFFTVAKVLPLLVLVILGAFFIEPGNLTISTLPSQEALSEGALILFFAFGGGAEASLNATGEIKDPARTIPRGIFLGALAVFIIYLSIQIVSQGVLGSALPQSGEAPLAEVAKKFAGSYGLWLLLFGAIVSCYGLISGDILATSRLPYAAARDGLLPAFLSKVHNRFATPYWAIIVYAGIGFILAVSGGFKQLAILSSAAVLLIYIGVILATIKLRKASTENSFRIPGGLTVPILALLVTAWFLSSLTRQEVLAVGIFIGFFSVVYWGLNRKKKRA